jgi:hypothetical protein
MGEFGTLEPLRLRDDVVATVLDDGALLLDLDTKYFYVLNKSAWAVVQLFESGTSVEHARKVCAAAAINPLEIDELVHRLADEQLVEAAEADTTPAFSSVGEWCAPTLEKQQEPLQRVIVNAFDPSIPLAE